MLPRIVVALVVFAWFAPNEMGQDCVDVPPCSRVHADSILFVGLVLDPGAGRVQVEEVFAGLRPDIGEIAIRTWERRLDRGDRYLFDAEKWNDVFVFKSCGASGPVTSEYVAPVVDYLRRRARGVAETTLMVNVVDLFEPVAGVDVTISSPTRKLTARTDAEGIARFERIPPAMYRLFATKSGYRSDSSSDTEVEIVAGACAEAAIYVETDGRVSGILRGANGEPVSSLVVELVALPDPKEERARIGPRFHTKTDARGRFRFENVSPGRYYLGANIRGANSSSVPPSYYPGSRSARDAVPIEVGLGEAVGNLVFTLPNFGARREIRVCIVDGDGAPVPSVWLANGTASEDGGDLARLGDELRARTGADGCFAALGYEGARYSLYVLARTTDGTQSGRIVVEPWVGPVTTVFKLPSPE